MDLVILISVYISALVVVVLLIRKWISDLLGKNNPSSELTEWLKSTNTRLDNAAHSISEVNKSIGEMSQIGKSMKELEEFLKSPKLRGNLGEQVLNDLLSQMLPKKSFHLKYPFKGGAIVDAAITTSNGIIPIDSKFPLENFRKLLKAENEADKKSYSKAFTADVKKHIDDISGKYILTDEGTIDYALMYLPSESVYYEVAQNQDLFEYAHKMRVMPVSPVTFYAYLRSILMSFEGQKIELKAREILSTLRSVQNDYSSLEDNLALLNKHLNNAHNQMSNVTGASARLGRKISTASLLPDEK